jgi:chromosome partitioning protein
MWLNHFFTGIFLFGTWYFHMIVTVGHTKGGVGKTTLAVNLAIARALAGRDVWLIDADRQGTAQRAIAIRSEAGHLPGVACAHYPDGATLRGQLQHQKHKWQDIIIDVGGRDSTALRAAIILADVLLVPFQPRSYDVWSLEDIAALIEEARALHDFQAYAVLNLADPERPGLKTSDNREAAEAVNDLPGLRYLPTPIGDRKAFANAGGQGLSVLEGRPKDSKACEELNALVSAVFNMPSKVK